MSKPAPRLGRGLSALISTREPAPQAQPAAAAEAEAPGDVLRRIPIERISPNPNQPRKQFDPRGIEELAASIRNSGVLQPVLVRPAIGDDYELIAGERRWRAAKSCGLTEIPAIVREVTDQEALELALIENLQREDLNPLERAAAYQEILERLTYTPEVLAARLGESRANVVNYVRLLKLAPEVQELVRRGELAMGQARAIAGVSDPQRQLAIARLAVRRNLAVRQVEALCKETPDGAQPQRGRADAGAAKHLDEVAETLSRGLGLRVRLVPGKRKNSGRIIIGYDNLEQFDLISERLGGRSRVD